MKSSHKIALVTSAAVMLFALVIIIITSSSKKTKKKKKVTSGKPATIRECQNYVAEMNTTDIGTKQNKFEFSSHIAQIFPRSYARRDYIRLSRQADGECQCLLLNLSRHQFISHSIWFSLLSRVARSPLALTVVKSLADFMDCGQWDAIGSRTGPLRGEVYGGRASFGGGCARPRFAPHSVPRLIRAPPITKRTTPSIVRRLRFPRREKKSSDSAGA